MVADTSFLTANIAPIPMIWVAPLALYLLSFILSFDHHGWYQRGSSCRCSCLRSPPWPTCRRSA